MKLESLHICNVRGIVDLKLDLDGQNFVVEGPNGSGKSGVVDAIEFVFTGRMARLEGPGMGGVSVRTHGPHVDQRDNAHAAAVTATVRLANGQVATVRRTIARHKTPEIEPREAVEELQLLCGHPEIALSRRELIKLIIAEPGRRAEAIQILLKLDDLGAIRKNLISAANAIDKEYQAANSAAASARVQFLSAAGVQAMKVEEVLPEVNKRRALLGLDSLVDIEGKRLVEGFSETQGARSRAPVNREIALRDLEAFQAFLERRVRTNEHAAELLRQLAKLDARPDLLTLLEEHDLVQAGLELLSEPRCPLCDKEWDLDALRAHLTEKKRRGAEAQAFADGLKAIGARLVQDVHLLSDHLGTLSAHAASLGEEPAATLLRRWRAELMSFCDHLGGAKSIAVERDRLRKDWARTPEALPAAMQGLGTRIREIPIASESAAARDYLVRCDERLEAWRVASRTKKRSEQRRNVARRAASLFNEVAERRLTALYDDVENDFARFYRFVNDDDEPSFAAKLEPSSGKLSLEVDFYGRGQFPPSAYHSEGHQDGMGLCLYLALMKRLFGDRFEFGVLDDVLMSVDTGHRKKVCELLKTEFPRTQFVITTHDEVWMRQMVSRSLVDKRSVKRFRGWKVDCGPLVNDHKELWDSIAEKLDQGEVSSAASELRRTLEQIAGELCEKLRASTPHRNDGNHDLGDLLPAAVGKWKSLLKEAKAAANSWNRRDTMDAIAAREALFDARLAQRTMEQWAINPSVHYNEWANLSKNDFAPVVDAFRALIECFRCETCGSWVSVTPSKGPAKALLCDCSAINFSLTKKS